VRHERFEWDAGKARQNLSRHRISFEEAAAVLADPFSDYTHFEDFDDRHSANEERWKTMGSYPFDRSRVFLIVWTVRSDADGTTVTRIISARHVTAPERRTYQNETRNR
jgi:uncharacterized DUF497 family protein